MKKYLFLFAVATLGFTACSNDDVVAENNTLGQQPKEIAFFPLSQPNTRTAVEGSVFTPTTMQVSAYDATTPCNFFTNVTFTKDETTWKGGKYWPLAPVTINFLAYSELTAGSATWNATNPTSAVTLVMGDNKTAQNDLMYACGTVTQSGNTLTFPDNVPMVFKHAQAYIKFTVKAKTSSEATAITVNSITLNSVSCQGTFTVTHTNWDKPKSVVRATSL